MMWKIVSPNSQLCLEPVELRTLKQQLAGVSCKCSVCNHYTYEPLDEKVPHQVDKKDVEVQAERYVLVDPKSDSTSGIKGALCPTCCMTLNILRDGIVKVLKDEEAETVTSMFSCDKASGKRIKTVEKNTSAMFKSLSPRQYSNLTLCDILSEGPSDIAVSPQKGSGSRRKRSHQDRVKFVDAPCQKSEELSTIMFNRKCVCLEDFIDAIRPPVDVT